MKTLARIVAFAAAATSLAGTTAFAAGTTTTNNAQPSKPKSGLLSLLHKPKPTAHKPLLGHKPMFAGNIIGNKNSHVFHMPGDPGQLPAPQNRVYFKTSAQAIAAGYHRAGQKAAVHTAAKSGIHTMHPTHH